jgi:hypothetical protein
MNCLINTPFDFASFENWDNGGINLVYKQLEIEFQE